MRGKGSQLIIIITDHGYNDHQTSQGTSNNVSLYDNHPNCNRIKLFKCNGIEPIWINRSP